MARKFADISKYGNPNSNRLSPLDAALQGFNQGVQLEQLPQTLQNQALETQLKNALAQAKIQELSGGKIFEVGNNLVRQNPQTGAYESIFTAPSNTTTTPESQQFVGFDQASGKPIVFGPKSGLFRSGELPPGVTAPTGLIPKTQTPETQQLAGFDSLGNAIQFGNKGSGISNAPIQQGTNITGPLQPKTQPNMRKGVLLQDNKGNVKYDVLSEGESLPEGSKLFTEPKAADESGLRKEFISNPVVKDFTEIAPQYQRIQSALEEAKTSKNFTAVDQTLVNTFNRILDPQSVVREAEYARTAADQSILQYLKGKYDPSTGRLVLGGAGLTPETRDAMQRMAKRFFDTSQNNYTQTAAFYSNIAQNRGFDPSLIVPPIGGFNFQKSPVSSGGKNDEALQWLQSNPSHPDAPKIRKILGF